MARTVKDHSFRKQGRPAKYDWLKWTNGKSWAAGHGNDFTCSPEIFRRQCHQVAKARNLKVETNIEGDTVYFRFHPKQKNRKQQKQKRLKSEQG